MYIQHNLNQNHSIIFIEIKTNVPKFILKFKVPNKPDNLLEEFYITLLDFKNYYKIIVIKTVWYWHSNWQINNCNKKLFHIYIYGNICGKLKENTGSIEYLIWCDLSHTIQKFGLRYFILLVISETINLLEENLKSIFMILGWAKIFLNRKQKVQVLLYYCKKFLFKKRYI